VHKQLTQLAPQLHCENELHPVDVEVQLDPVVDELALVEEPPLQALGMGGPTWKLPAMGGLRSQ